MHPSLSKPILDPIDRQALQRMLALGPWIWPSSGDQLDRAQSVSSLAHPPQLQVGETLYVSVTNSGQAALWAGQRQCTSGQLTGAWSQSAQKAWTTAVQALSCSVPVMSCASSNLFTPPSCTFLYGDFKVALDGTSFGLAFLLSAASRALLRPLPATHVGLATVSATGQVGPVAALKHKIQCIESIAASVTHVLVATEQLDEAKQYATKLIPVGLRHAREALETLFGDIESIVVDVSNEPHRRQQLCTQWLQLATGGLHASMNWITVAHAARLAQQRWTQISAFEEGLLTFVNGVAGRHLGRSTQMPPAEWYTHLPQPLRVQAVANAVADAASGGRTPADWALTLAEAYLVRGHDAFGEHLMLHGAYAHLLNSLGQHETALERQKEAALGWRERGHLTQISYPLASWLRLASALDDDVSFTAATQLYHNLKLFHDFGFDAAYVDAAIARGHLDFNRPTEAVKTLDNIAPLDELPIRLQASCLRTRVTANRALDNPEQAAKDYARLTALSDGDFSLPKVLQLFCDLDEALSGDAAHQSQVIDQLLSHRSNYGRLVARMLEAHNNDQTAAIYLARFFPL